MLLRKLIVAVCPLAICGLVCGLFRWLDGILGSTAYASFVFKGALLGAALALTLPIAGVKAYTNGLAGWLLAGAALMGAVILYQYLETTGAVHAAVLSVLLAVNGQVVLVESAAMGYLLAAGLWYRKR